MSIPDRRPSGLPPARRLAASFVLQLALSAACVPGRASDERDFVRDGELELPPAESVLSSVRDGLPGTPILIRGQVLRGGLPRQRKRIFFFDAELDFSSDPSSIQYTLRDAFGTVRHQLLVAWFADGEVNSQLEEDGNVRPLDNAGFNRPIPNTDLTWSDLALAFLWRGEGRTVAVDRIKGRECYVVEFAPPAGAASGGGVRVWIDTKMLVLLKMEETDRNGQLARSFSVKDFRRVSGVWMIKNVEVRSHPGKNRTLVRVDELYAPGLDDFNAPALEDAE